MGGPLMSINFNGKAAVKAMLKKAQGTVRPAMAAGMYQLGCAVISDSIPRAPKDTGTLRNSAYCELPQGRGDNVSVTGGYGGFAKAYALVQHENTSYRHTEGSSKYLDKAFKRIAPNAARYLAGVIANALESGRTPPLQSFGVAQVPGGRGSGTRKKRTPKKVKRSKRRKRKLSAAQKKLGKARARMAKTKANVKHTVRNQKRRAKGWKKLRKRRGRKKK